MRSMFRVCIFNLYEDKYILYFYVCSQSGVYMYSFDGLYVGFKVFHVSKYIFQALYSIDSIYMCQVFLYVRCLCVLKIMLKV